MNCVNRVFYHKTSEDALLKDIFGMKMKIPNSGSGNDYGHETDIISYMDNNFESDLDVQGTEDSDFSEYLWMENEEEFDKEVIQQLMEEELTEECLKAMWEDERQHERNTSKPENVDNELWQQLNRLNLPDDIAERSTLNPNAAEFVPAFKPAVTSVSTPPEVTAESS
ncbi:PREDICTED: polyadenylate-binding protein-interacting protein 2 isoform X2 [Dufourea novaeangliae]|uniref:polyadenylate-binding protein-interacting protein 2 isoform X2 n=1 Tax=Dufourea novaeangliae TaxID=178035 RepID=UPI000766F87E|nr:PREDICTED: polyadenylate-binding protein-interacting protein 2 isoform X2 [Dufourea novaeangliae]